MRSTLPFLFHSFSRQVESNTWAQTWGRRGDEERAHSAPQRACLSWELASPASILLSPASLSQPPLTSYFLFLFAITQVLLPVSTPGQEASPPPPQRRREGGSEPKEVQPPEGPPTPEAKAGRRWGVCGGTREVSDPEAFLKQSWGEEWSPGITTQGTAAAARSVHAPPPCPPFHSSSFLVALPMCATVPGLLLLPAVLLPFSPSLGSFSAGPTPAWVLTLFWGHSHYCSEHTPPAPPPSPVILQASLWV